MDNKKFNETDSFKETQNAWYTKIKDETDFVDIENGKESTIVTPQVFTEVKRQYFGGQEYSEFCQSILRSYNFRNELDETIFSLHADGKSDREIETWLKNNNKRPLSHMGVHKIIKKIKSEFGDF